MLCVPAVPDVAAIVVKRCNDTELEEPLAERPRGGGGAHVPIHHAHHRQRHVQHVLDIVIVGVTLTVTGLLAAIEPAEIFERPEQAGRRIPLV
jgi:hypothetical protein